MLLKTEVTWFFLLITVILAQEYFPTYLNGTNYATEACNSISNSTTYLGQDGICHARKDINEICSNDNECLWEGRFLKCIDNRCGCEESSKIETFNKSGTWADETRNFLVYKTFVRSPYSSTLRKLNPEYMFRTQPYILANDTGTIIYGQYFSEANSSFIWVRAKVRTNYTPEAVLTQCVGIAKHRCNPDGKCVGNAECQNSTTNGGEQICTCQRPFLPTSSGSCGLPQGQFCGITRPCGDSLICTDSRCECSSLRHFYHDSTRNRCLGLISASCSSNSECTNNAICELNPESNRTQCSCAVGYIENEAGRCDKAWNTTCEDGSTLEKCDTLAGLKCRNGFCVCPDSMSSYNDNSRSCQFVVGSRCYPGTTCMDGAECRTKHHKLTGRCLCKAGYKLSDNQLCTKVVTDDPPSEVDAILKTTLLL